MKYIPDIVDGWYYEVSEADYEAFRQFLARTLLKTDLSKLRVVRLDNFVEGYDKAIEDVSNALQEFHGYWKIVEVLDILKKKV